MVGALIGGSIKVKGSGAVSGQTTFDMSLWILEETLYRKGVG